MPIVPLWRSLSARCNTKRMSSVPPEFSGTSWKSRSPRQKRHRTSFRTATRKPKVLLSLSFFLIHASFFHLSYSSFLFFFFAKDNVSRLQDRLRELHAQRENSLRAFGDSVPRVLQAIEKERGQFHHRVVGPVGRHISLKDKKWSLAMSGIIGGVLPNFIVQDFHDANVLKEIFRKNGW